MSDTAKPSPIVLHTPGVYLVIDMHGGQAIDTHERRREYSLYFHLNQGIHLSWYAASRLQRPSSDLKEIGFVCLEFGPCKLGAEHVVAETKKALALPSGVTWDHVSLTVM
jgi:hypothetical protein